jgi:hypothetical protein
MVPESEAKPSRIVITFEDEHSAICRVDIENVNPMQMFSMTKQLEIIAETLYMQQQAAAQQNQTKLVLPQRQAKPFTANSMDRIRKRGN